MSNPFWDGILVGMIFIILCVTLDQYFRESDCQQKHNVDDCVRVYVPTTPAQGDSDE